MLVQYFRNETVVRKCEYIDAPIKGWPCNVSIMMVPSERAPGPMEFIWAWGFCRPNLG